MIQQPLKRRAYISRVFIPQFRSPSFIYTAQGCSAERKFVFASLGRRTPARPPHLQPEPPGQHTSHSKDTAAGQQSKKGKLALSNIFSSSLCIMTTHSPLDVSQTSVRLLMPCSGRASPPCMTSTDTLRKKPPDSQAPATDSTVRVCNPTCNAFTLRLRRRLRLHDDTSSIAQSRQGTCTTCDSLCISHKHTARAVQF